VRNDGYQNRTTAIEALELQTGVNTAAPRPPVPAARTGPAASAKPKKERIPPGTKFVYLMWTFILFDPQWYVAKYVGSSVGRIPTVLFAIMLVLVFFKPPKFWFPPLLAFMLYTMAIIPFSYNRGQTFVVVKALIAYYVIAIGTMAFVRNVRQAVPIVKAALFWQFGWWVVLGCYKGRVGWHPMLGNPDSYGPLMVIGVGAAYFYGLATRNKRDKKLAFLTSIGCIIGLVSSFARGAFLGAIAVICWAWLRSNRKGVTSLAVVGGVVCVVIGGVIFNGAKRAGTGTTAAEQRGKVGANWFTEMATIGASGDGTRSDRSVLWALARRVWRENPIIGVGAMNFGAYAAGNFAAGTTGGQYDDNPGRLYSRQLHSTFFQILCEYGTIGTGIFFWMLADFFKRNAQMRKPAFRKRWALVSGGELDLGQLARAVETAMIGYLTTGLFYNQIFDIHWLYTLLTINSVMHVISKPLPKAAPVRFGTLPA